MSVQLHDKTFDLFLTSNEIQTRISEVCEYLNRDYADKRPVFIAILNGSFMFAADVMRRFNGACEIQFVRLASYVGTSSTGEVQTILGLSADLKGRHVVILEDIIDSGETMVSFLPLLAQKEVASCQICSFLVKPDALKHPIDVAYRCFDIPNEFVVGYGLDYDGLGRNLPDVYHLH